MIVGKDVGNISAKVPEDAYDTGKYMPTFNVYLTAIVRDSMGRVIRVHRQRSHSPTANFIGLLLPVSYYIGSNSSYTIVNVAGSTYSYSPAPGCDAPGILYPYNNSSVYVYFTAIQVGSGQQSSPFNAHSLAAPIANGSGAGQLVYGSPSLPANVTASGSSAYIVITQEYINQSGGTINVTEVGIMLYLQFVAACGGGFNNYGNTLVWYDVLSSAISVPAGGSLTIYYTFTVNP
jgi:hypothetical protein